MQHDNSSSRQLQLVNGYISAAAFTSPLVNFPSTAQASSLMVGRRRKSRSASVNTEASAGSKRNADGKLEAIETPEPPKKKKTLHEDDEPTPEPTDQQVAQLQKKIQELTEENARLKEQVEKFKGQDEEQKPKKKAPKAQPKEPRVQPKRKTANAQPKGKAKKA